MEHYSTIDLSNWGYTYDLLKDKNKCIIYTLNDPITDEIRYIGKTSTKLSKRLNKHCIIKNTKCHRHAWIKGLLNKNKKPIIKILDIVNTENWQLFEIYWISQFKQWGYILLNETDGGEGVPTGTIPWNKNLHGIMKANKTTFKSGNKIGSTTRFKTGHNLGKPTQFKKGQLPYNTKPVYQYNKITGELINEWISCADAARFYKTTLTNILHNTLGHSKTAIGYIWNRDKKNNIFIHE